MDFLESYKNLEQELKYENMSVLDYENTLGDSEKLKVCRIIRNFISHNSEKFCIGTPEMCKYLDSLTLEIRHKSHTVKDEMKKYKTVGPMEQLKNVLPLLVKGQVPVLDKDRIIFLVDSNYYVSLAAKGLRKLELPKKLPKILFTSKDERIINLTAGLTYVVTTTGTADGKYLGLVII